MTFSQIFKLYVQKAKKKERTIEEVKAIVSWLTGYSEEKKRYSRHRHYSTRVL